MIRVSSGKNTLLFPNHPSPDYVAEKWKGTLAIWLDARFNVWGRWYIYVAMQCVNYDLLISMSFKEFHRNFSSWLIVVML